jgi:hypothetical protein
MAWSEEIKQKSETRLNLSNAAKVLKDLGAIDQGAPSRPIWYLSRPTGAKSARSEASARGLLIVDYAADGQPIGIEMTAPAAVTLDQVNALLARLDQPPLREDDFRPLVAA